MERWLGKYTDEIYAALRIVAGLMFASHGAQKLFGVMGGQSQLDDVQGLAAGIIEFAGGLLIALGLFTSAAAFISSGEMAVAYFKAHFPQGFWPVVNQGELAALYCFLFLYIAARGSGPLSLDRLRKRRR